VAKPNKARLIRQRRLALARAQASESRGRDGLSDPQVDGAKTSQPPLLSLESEAPSATGTLRDKTESDHATVVLAAVVYCIIVAIMWARSGLHSGMGYETGFPYSSMTNTWWNGFLYTADPLRIHTNTFYHLSYLIAKILGIDGSYEPFQVVYATLWWTRGLLVFLILRRFFPGDTLLCYLAGSLVLVHASDRALQWVGQMNQFGFIFWMLLSFYLLLEAFRTDHAIRAVFVTSAACFFEQMSLFSYESQLLLLLAYPIVLLALRRRWRKWLLMSAAWYVVPAYYFKLTAVKYLHSGGSTYQESVMRKGWGVASIVNDWCFNIAASLEFWAWPRPSLHSWVAPAITSAAVMVAGGFGTLVLTKTRGLLCETARVWWTLLAAGFAAVALSFPVYLLLDSARLLWRTQFLSGIGAGLVFTALLGLLSHKLPWRAARVAILLSGGAAVVYYGSLTAMELGEFHRGIWERHRKAITEVLRVVPNVKPDAIVVLTNVPKDADPFGGDIWYDFAIRLIYPGIRVAGVYYYADGTRAPGDTLVAVGDSWKWDKVTGFPPLIDETSLAHTVVVRYAKSGTGSLETALPAFLCHDACASELYNPSAMITGSIAPSAARRYRLGEP
jgi:hypothetical protein